MGLRRGAAWVTLTVKPPHIIGPNASLKLSKGLMTGASAGSGPVHIKISREEALGQGPGRVDVDFTEGVDEYRADGLWNNAPVHLKVTSDSLKASINGATGHCQYELNKTTPDGARTGFSICFGSSEETRLEVPRKVHAFLTASELAVVLLQLLSAPPHTTMERQFPVF
jgi:hypothetical protein